MKNWISRKDSQQYHSGLCQTEQNVAWFCMCCLHSKASTQVKPLARSTACVVKSSPNTKALFAWHVHLKLLVLGPGSHLAWASILFHILLSQSDKDLSWLSVFGSRYPKVKVNSTLYRASPMQHSFLLPSAQGRYTIRRLKANRQFKTIPVLYLKGCLLNGVCFC